MVFARRRTCPGAGRCTWVPAVGLRMHARHLRLSWSHSTPLYFNKSLHRVFSTVAVRAPPMAWKGVILHVDTCAALTHLQAIDCKPETLSSACEARMADVQKLQWRKPQ